jgi:hypothetical protein
MQPVLRSLILTLFLIATACGPRAHLLPAPEKRIQFSLLEDYDKGENLDQIVRDFDLFEELGVTVWRGSFGWDDYESTRGAYGFDRLHTAQLPGGAAQVIEYAVDGTPMRESQIDAGRLEGMVLKPGDVGADGQRPSAPREELRS